MTMAISWEIQIAVSSHEDNSRGAGGKDRAEALLQSLDGDGLLVNSDRPVLVHADVNVLVIRNGTRIGDRQLRDYRKSRSRNAPK